MLLFLHYTFYTVIYWFSIMEVEVSTRLLSPSTRLNLYKDVRMGRERRFEENSLEKLTL